MDGLPDPHSRKTNRGLLDHAITIAETFEQEARGTRVLEPKFPLPAMKYQPAPPIESFFPHADYQPDASLRTKALLDEKERIKKKRLAEEYTPRKGHG